MGNKFLRGSQRLANIEEKVVSEAQNLWNQGGISSFSELNNRAFGRV